MIVLLPVNPSECKVAFFNASSPLICVKGKKYFNYLGIKVFRYNHLFKSVFNQLLPSNSHKIKLKDE